MIINHNISAMNTYRQLSINESNTSKSLQKLSSGQRINSASDDAAGLAISEKMKAQIRGLDQASRNAQDGISLVQTAEGALSETQDILQRMRELSVQAASDTNVSVDRDAIQQEMNQMTSEINRIGNTTQFNTQNLLNGDKANTFKVTGTSFSGGSATKSLLAGTASLVNGVLSSGGYTLKITTHVSGGTKVVSSGGITVSGLNNKGVALSESVADVTYNGTSGKPTFAGSISITTGVSGQLVTGASGSGSFKIYNSGGQVVVSGVNSSGVNFKDYVSKNASGKFAYNQHGVSFTINSISGWQSGATHSVSYTKAANSGVNNSLGTSQTLWSNVSVSGNATAASFQNAISGNKINIASGQSGKMVSGTYNIQLINSGGGKGTIKITGTSASGNFSGTISGIDTTSSFHFSGYGISFGVTLSGLGSGGSGTMQFDVRNQQTVAAVSDNVYQTTYSAQLLDASGHTVASGVIGKSAVASGSGASSGKGQTLSSAVSGAGIGAGLKLSFAAGTALSGGTTASFNVTRTTSGTDKSLTFQIGANQAQSMSLDINDMRSVALGVSSTTGGSGFSSTLDVTDGTDNNNVENALDVSTSANAANAITVINNAINKVSAERAKLGATQNRLEHTINNLGTSSQNLQSAESRIVDVDMASEMVNFTKNNILQQAAQSMLAQANQQPQGVLQLLR